MKTICRRTLGRLVAGSALAVAGFGVAGFGGPAFADPPALRIGVTISTTGQGAALGIPEKNTLDVIAREIGGTRLEIIQLDDAGDPTNATTNARRLATEDKVDVLIGSSVTPATIAVANVAFESAVPHFALSPMAFQPGRDTWTFVMPQPVPLMAKGLFENMTAKGVKTVGIIGFSDSWGDLWVKEFKASGEPMGLKMVADERYARADTSVAGQVLKLLAAKPDAVLVGASGTAAALPVIALRQRGYTGPIYQTHGAVTRDFIRIAGKAAEGVIFVSGPVIAAAKQPDDALTKAPGVAYTAAYEAKFGPGTITQFGAHMYDVFELLKRAVPVALKSAEPGTQAFRDALRDALESEKEMAASQAVYSYGPGNHYGVDGRGRILVTVKDGDWAIVQ
ncbi:ABC transporter substrate-binding protein [Blastochloris tepida]|uniref:Branched-chain amino acid ABC transporter substrate-binding protein n=1 Tax=Blastochloris tepida TaxID=2233851 RepID=A0A348G069_9HYPH|nr:ABC transporter substrate-binding protein [Blastochloris tepida]BBF92952.1 branched-chain amino acid ABC transporter substrate-binding protein [Blastochloris tepida]